MAYIVSQLIIMYFRRNHYILNHSASSILLEIIYCAHAHTHTCELTPVVLPAKVLSSAFCARRPTTGPNAFSQTALFLHGDTSAAPCQPRRKIQVRYGSGFRNQWSRNPMTFANNVGSFLFLSLCTAKSMLSGWRRKQQISNSAFQKVFFFF